MPTRRLAALLSVLVVATTWQSLLAQETELVTLSARAWSGFVPAGKEVDAIYGDYVLRNELITLVIAQQDPNRNANMTVRGVAGCVIDMTTRRRGKDQLSCFYPTASEFSFVEPGSTITIDGQQRPLRPTDEAKGKELIVRFPSKPRRDGVRATCGYRLADGERFITVTTEYSNEGDQPARVNLADAFRADRTFSIGHDEATRVVWLHDEWFQQAYSVISADRVPVRSDGRQIVVSYQDSSLESHVELQPGETHVLERKLLVTPSSLQGRAHAHRLAQTPLRRVRLVVEDAAGPVTMALLTVTAAGSETPYGTSRGNQFVFGLPEGEFELKLEALGRPPVEFTTPPSGTLDRTITMESCGYAIVNVTDEQGRAIPAKIAIHGANGTPDPDFGPDSRDVSCHNLYYAHDGRMRQELGPGTYEIIVSRGPEFDAEFFTIGIDRSHESTLNVSLKRSVDTRGWVSADFHSHSSPSGDNTAGQLGRVLNLLCENIEFAPCTEHNRVDSYDRHLRRLDAGHLMATCSGIELTGSPLPINHQNAFPLVWKPRTQDGGGPRTDFDPLRQIQRLAGWDNDSDKLLQGNHPDVLQIYGDKNADGVPDGGFRQMFEFMDVMEVHPPDTIFEGPPSIPGEGRRNTNRIFHWMQLLNQGYRLPGVANTDAHYNFHGSGWLRNYVRSSSDDPAEISIKEMVDHSTQGRLMMTTGPFLEVTFSAEGTTVDPGQDLAAPGKKVDCHVRVQCPNWLDVNRVQLFLNGRPSTTHQWTRREQPEAFGNEVVKFDKQFQIDLEGDTHVIVAVINEGQQLGRVMGPSFGRMAPVAVANPVFVDVDGGGFQANLDELDYPLPK